MQILIDCIANEVLLRPACPGSLGADGFLGIGTEP
jgi:hypothetical protein